MRRTLIGAGVGFGIHLALVALFGPYRDLVIACGELFIRHADIADLPAVAGVGLFVTSAAAGLLGATIERLVR